MTQSWQLMKLKYVIIITVTATLPVAVSSQLITVTSTIPAGAVVCPGKEVNITCETRESAIITWMSPIYIGDQIGFNTANMINDTQRGSADFNTVATLVKNTIENRTLVLVSLLQIVVSGVSLNPTVTCIHGSNNIPDTFTFNVLADPGVPQTTAVQTEDPMGKCTVQIAWIAPMNIAIESISYFMISVTNSPGLATFDVNNTNNNTLISVSYPLCSCTTHNVSVRAVNFCNREGQPSINKLVESDPLDHDVVCQDIEHIAGTTTGPATPNTPIARNNCSVILGTVAGILTSLLLVSVIAIASVIICLAVKLKKRPKQDKTEAPRMVPKHHDVQRLASSALSTSTDPIIIQSDC